MVGKPIESRSRSIKIINQKKKFIGLSLIVLAMVLSLVFQAVQAEWLADSSELKVWVFDVGQADAIFIETPEGEQILVDAGAGEAVLTKLGQVMAPWDRTINTVIITHPHADHEGGLPEVLSRYQVETIYETGVLGYDDLQASVKELADEQGTEIKLISEGTLPPSYATYGGGQGWGLNGGGLGVGVLSPDTNLQNKKIDNLNNASVVLLLTYGETSILLTGDAPIDEENEILDDIGESIDVLKVAHHGSVTSTSGNFLDIITPRYGIISVGAENDYGHPHPATLERLSSRNVEIFRTDLEGDILITSTGGEPMVESRPLPF